MVNKWICEQCGSDDKSVRRFYHFSPLVEEKLCWDCSYPIIKARLQGAKTGEDTTTEGFIPSLDEW